MQTFRVVEHKPFTGETVVLKVAVMAVSAERVTVQVPVPEQLPPDQPENVEPEAGVAVKVIEVPEDIPDCVQVEPQEIVPPVTVPVPVPDLETERV